VKIASMLQEETIYHADQRDGPLAAPLVLFVPLLIHVRLRVLLIGYQATAATVPHVQSIFFERT
jgi:hypothetical protein